MMKQTICSIEDCGRPVHCRGWCDRHYKCWHKHGDPLWRPLTVVERFWSNVDKDGPIHPILGTPCWLRTTGKTVKGYSCFRDVHLRDGRKIYAHRFAYELAVAGTMFAPWIPLPTGVEVDHRCHVKLCVNPQHLRATTRKQNMENLRGARRDSKSGVRGVIWSTRRNCWRAQVRHNGKQISAGYFETVAEAEMAVIAKRNELFTHNDADR